MKTPKTKTPKAKTPKAKTPKAAKTVRGLLGQIHRATKGGNYIYRGENKKNDKISSKLYRYIEPIFSKTVQEKLGKSVQKAGYIINVEEIQKEFILQEVQEYVDFENEIDTLAELQHYRGSTNLIDFSHDLAVALFFACDGEHKKDGRLILFRINAKTKGVIYPKKNQNNRTVFQKSIFVQRDNGYIKEKVKQFTVSKNLKKTLLTYVQNYFGIRTETIYGDLMGYIQNQERHSEAYKQFFAGALYDKINLKEAVKCYTRAIKLKPNFSQAYNNRAAAKLEEKLLDSEGAITDCDEAIKHNPNYAQAYCNRGTAKMEEKSLDLEGAVVDFTKAIKLKSNYARAYGNRGIAYNYKKKYDLAIADLSKAISLNSNDIFSYNNRGTSYKEKGNYDLALADFNEAIALNSKSATVLNNRGNVYHKKGNYDLAIADFTKAIKLNPKYAQAYYNLGITKKILQDDKEAKKYFKIALRLAKKQKKESLVAEILKKLNKFRADSDS